MSPCRLVLADDHPLIRQHIRCMLAGNPEFQVDAELSDGLDLLYYMDTGAPLPDVILMDIAMPKLRGIEATRRIKDLHPQVKVLILTVHKEREYLNAALSAGAEGYVLKDYADAELLPALSAVRNGNTYISPYFRSAVNPAVTVL